MSQDRELQEAVLAEFRWEPGVTAAHIGVTARDGVVTLAGHVATYLDKHGAARAAARVQGVKAVADEIEVTLPVECERRDEDIARAAVDRLAWEASIPADAVTLEVDQGWITLTGAVAWHYQREAAERVVHGLRGVTGVSNLITLAPSVNVIEIGRDIAATLHRAWFNPATIAVSSKAGKVTLTGTVKTLREKHKAGTIAWDSPGTTDVENDLVVAG